MRANKNKLIPELRFPEFKNDGEWKNTILNDVGETVSSLSGKSGENFGSGKPYVTYKQVYNNSFVDFSKCEKVYIGINENQNEVKKGDILFTTSSETPNEVGFASVVLNSPNEPTYLNSFCFVFRPKNLDYLIPEFSRYLFYSDIYRKSIGVLAQGSTRFNISKGAFLNLKLSIPKSDEQQKIASCLSSFDKIITTQTEKLELLQNHKKGLMQNLFPQDGEKVPKYRFPEFLEDGYWKEIKLGDKKVSSFVNEKISVNILNVNSYISTANMLPKFSGISTALKLPELGSITKFMNGDILMSNIRPYLKKVWKANTIGGASNDVLVFRSGSSVSNEFLEHIIKNDSFIKYVMESAKGVKMPRGDKDSIKDYMVLIPTLNEQQKIASCLLSLDNLIISQREKIDQLKLHKKGLMQGLFPSSN